MDWAIWNAIHPSTDSDALSIDALMAMLATAPMAGLSQEVSSAQTALEDGIQQRMS
jgi:hypothetical protein